VTQKSDETEEPIIIKKYANRRLYNTATSTYVTLDDLAEMVKSGVDFSVKDAKSNEDITHSVLTQIIFEQEAKGENMLPVNFLRQIIRFYGDNMQHVVPSFLNVSADMLAREQDDLRKAMGTSFNQTPFDAMEEQVRQNMDMFKQAVSMFSPFSDPTGDMKDAPREPAKETKSTGPSDMEVLRNQLAQMQSQLDRLDKDKS
jgi:polyhydroxyalkanoate synthesis repressor PhaR